jgi:hypothetical protein
MFRYQEQGAAKRIVNLGLGSLRRRETTSIINGDSPSRKEFSMRNPTYADFFKKVITPLV